MSALDIINEYTSLPLLPVSQKITVQKIGVYNWDTQKREARSMMNYGLFTANNLVDYPVAKNPILEYKSDEQVSPVVIIDKQGNKYKTHMIHWFPLIDIHDGIILKQSLTRQKILPFTVFIDENSSAPKIHHKWIQNLFNLVGLRFINSLEPQL